MSKIIQNVLGTSEIPDKFLHAYDRISMIDKIISGDVKLNMQNTDPINSNESSTSTQFIDNSPLDKPTSLLVPEVITTKEIPIVQPQIQIPKYYAELSINVLTHKFSYVQVQDLGNLLIFILKDAFNLKIR